ncbi:cytochrome c oxidase subunit 3 [Chitinilyticum piscinae]|uniref:cytochrome-c oxidase n=1 Tax=Chitinilyticum piscinae TaxID=2866724 RepID=A0A8J7K2U1_9NEIS|nr:cytochrome c oxidase subunit 3 [Chitinilyticum piscinae]MBE9610492.1 cytochrome c oxidase subunit 3 [Chitinilyticum piscinae]
MNVEKGLHDAHYFVPAPSRWPAVGAIALFCLGLGAALAINAVPAGWLLLASGGGLLLWMLFGWFGDVIAESESHAYGPQVGWSFRWGMAWFIFSEVMFFAAFFGALFYTRSIAVPELGGSGLSHDLLWPRFSAEWPQQTGPSVASYTPMGAHGIPSINTAILLSSGATLTWAHWALLKGQRLQLISGLVITVYLAALFLALQAAEYHHGFAELNLTLASGAYGATFYLLTGFHGLHVLVGSLLLCVILARSARGDFDERHHFAFEAAAWYWHFVDVVWLLLFVTVYWL